MKQIWNFSGARKDGTVFDGAVEAGTINGALTKAEKLAKKDKGKITKIELKVEIPVEHPVT